MYENMSDGEGDTSIKGVGGGHKVEIIKTKVHLIIS